MHKFLYSIYIMYRGDFLTNINCISNCIYQIEGKCSYSKVEVSKFVCSKECIYFEEKK